MKTVNELLEEGFNVAGSLDEVIQSLQALKHKYPNHQLTVQMDEVGDEGGYHVNIYGARLETKDERKQRLESARRHRRRQLEQDLAQLERLTASAEVLRQKLKKQGVI